MKLKRAFDLLFAVPGLLVLSPLFLLIAVLIKLDSRGTVFFRQVRIGIHGRAFRIYKFRTMQMNAEKLGRQITVEKDARITRIGHVLRKYKLDELPQLFNVIRGEMSLVGPRPEVPRYVDMYTADQRMVIDLMPGITDPASIQYRDEGNLLAEANDPEQLYVKVIMPDKIRINLEYASRATVVTDFWIITSTFRRLSGLK